MCSEHGPPIPSLEYLANLLDTRNTRLIFLLDAQLIQNHFFFFLIEQQIIGLFIIF